MTCSHVAYCQTCWIGGARTSHNHQHAFVSIDSNESVIEPFGTAGLQARLKSTVHDGVNCDGCDKRNIIGIRFKCKVYAAVTFEPVAKANSSARLQVRRLRSLLFLCSETSKARRWTSLSTSNAAYLEAYTRDARSHGSWGVRAILILLSATLISQFGQ